MSHRFQFDEYLREVNGRERGPHPVPASHALIIAIVACVIAGALIWFVR